MSHFFDKKNIVIIIFSILIAKPFMAQEISRNKLFLKADNAFDYGDYLNALSIYEKLYLSDSTDNELNLRLGICNFEIKKHRTFSKKYFEKVSSSQFPEVNYYLGKLNHLTREYDTAIYYFNQYKNFGDDSEHSKKEIDDLIGKCHTAMLLESTADKTIQIKNLGSAINTEYPEYAPLIPAEENFILFTSRRKNDVWRQADPMGDYFEDIYISQNKGENWQSAVMLDTTINTSVHDAGTGLSADGEKILIYRTSKDLKSGDIYESSFISNKWTTPSLLGTNVNLPDYLETSACYSPGSETVFFSSNRPGGFGGKDLYLVKKLPNGNWGEPLNLGPHINTEYDEDAPFVHPSGNILFFSSKGHTNMGGFDIFKSEYTEESKFTIPENLGCPVNTVNDDIFFVLNTDASKGYLSSERAGGFGSQDIYVVFFPVNNIPLYAYNIHVYDASNTIINKVKITAAEIETESVYGIYKSNEQTGKILLISKPNKKYRITIQSDHYKLVTTELILNSDYDISLKLTDKNNE